jgi:hypothetical protein
LLGRARSLLHLLLDTRLLRIFAILPRIHVIGFRLLPFGDAVRPSVRRGRGLAVNLFLILFLYLPFALKTCLN